MAATNLDNAVLLCGHHHRLVHSGPWTITPTGPATFTFDPPPGTRRITTVHAGQRTATREHSQPRPSGSSRTSRQRA